MSNYSILKKGNMENACGGKAYGLYLLDSAGVTIPETLIIPCNLPIRDYAHEINLFIDDTASKYDTATFAVRSSARNEDGKSNSWAGIYESKLSVSADNVFETVVEMYYYSNTARKEAYDMFSGNTANTDMSLVVQRMIDPTISGVCFSINPINGNSSEIVIEVVEGLGDKLVSGMVTPQMYIVGEQGNCIYYDRGDRYFDTLLSEHMMYQIVKNVLFIKKELYPEADIEFVIQDNLIFFLQIRPITRIYNCFV